VARKKEARRPGRLWRGIERVVLGVMMGIAAYLVERRLRRFLGKHDSPHEERNDTAQLH
jgi:hypothetical protein